VRLTDLNLFTVFSTLEFDFFNGWVIRIFANETQTRS
jgi:hypothetical protein